MEHEKAQELLSDYLDGALEAESKARMEDHLEQCSDCRDDLEMLQQAMQVVRRLPPVRAPENFARRVRSRARAAGLLDRRKVRSRNLPFQSSMSTAILLAAVAGLILFVMIIQQQIELLVLPPEPPRIEYVQDQDLTRLADLAREYEGRVESLGQPLAAHETIEPGAELELIIPAQTYKEFQKAVELLGLKIDLPGSQAVPDGQGQIRVKLVKPAPNNKLPEKSSE